MRTEQKRKIGANAAKAALAMALFTLVGHPAKAVYWECNHTEGCNVAGGCEGDGIAYTGCQVWCYDGGGSVFTGYGNCS
jgi:hypothetical protein